MCPLIHEVDSEVKDVVGGESIIIIVEKVCASLRVYLKEQKVYFKEFLTKQYTYGAS
jgi:hypothetical protein